MGSGHDKEDPTLERLKRIELQFHLRSPYLWGVAVAAASFFLFMLWPAASNRWQSWNPGPLHSGHALMGNNCFECHDPAFSTVQDSACQKCHRVSDHGLPLNHGDLMKAVGGLQSGSAAAHAQTGGKRCGDCHIEHRDEKAFIPNTSRLCDSCHSNLKNEKPDASLASFRDWGEHAEFAIEQQGKRVRLDQLPVPRDENPLAFNHSVHLKKDLKGPNGTVHLTCETCHRFPHNDVKQVAITFEKDCRSCHELAFDDRLSQSRIPHGNTEAVYHYLLGEYAKLLGVAFSTEEFIAPGRSVPGRAAVNAAPVSEGKDTNIAAVVKEARKSEAVLFTKTACQLCHVVTEKTQKDDYTSWYDIAKPSVPRQWFVKARFSHAAHEFASCESCHGNVLTSKNTSDVLLPRINDCRGCHVDPGHQGLVSSDCSLCHAYHAALPLEGSSKRDVDDLLKSFAP